MELTELIKIIKDNLEIKLSSGDITTPNMVDENGEIYFYILSKNKENQLTKKFEISIKDYGTT